MKCFLFFSSLILLISSCSVSKSTTSSYSNAYENAYDAYLDKEETKVYSWYQGVTSLKNNKEFIIRLFYPEKNQITSLITYQLKNKDKKHGLYKTWFDNGGKKEEGTYVNDLKSGTWKYCAYPSSILDSEGNYRKGKKHGKWKRYDEGRLMDEITWVNGIKEGDFVEYDSLQNVINKGTYNADVITQQTNAASFPKQLFGNEAAFEELPYLKECEGIKDIKERKKASDVLLLKSIYENITYPIFARENNVEGKAIICFTVMEDGSLQNIYALSGICESIEKECIKIVNNLPVWNPGKQDGKAVRVKYNLPIKFKLN